MKTINREDLERVLRSGLRRDILLTLAHYGDLSLSEVLTKLNLDPKKKTLVYYHLRALMNCGLVTSVEKNGIKYYRLTELGYRVAKNLESESVGIKLSLSSILKMLISATAMVLFVTLVIGVKTGDVRIANDTIVVTPQSIVGILAATITATLVFLLGLLLLLRRMPREILKM